MENKLKQIKIFSILNPDLFKELINSNKVIIKTYNKNESIIRANDEYNYLYIITKGECFGELLDITGKIVKVEDLSAPRIIAAGILFADENKIPVSVFAKTDAEIVKIPKEIILELLTKDKKFLTAFLAIISKQVKFLTKRLSFMSFKSIKEKFIYYILSLPESEKNKIDLPMKIEELANFFGVTRPSLSRVISGLKNEGLIDYNKKEVIILNKEKLFDLIEE